MRTAITVSLITASMFLSTAGVAHANGASSCQSEWVKFKSFFDKNGPKIAKGVCQLFAGDDAAKAQKCVDDFEKNKAKVDQIINKYNNTAGDSAWKTGPRGLGEDRWKSGTLIAQRTFAGAPVMSDTYRLELIRTGGKAKKAMRGTVCFLDENGHAAASTDFTIDKRRTSFNRTFNNVAGLTPVILLSKPLGTDGHKYKIKGASGGEPEVVKKARKRAQAGGANNSNTCNNPCPKGGKYDGANCYIGSAPGGTKAFIYHNNYYYTPLPGNRCPLPGSGFDGANCYVKPAPKGTKPFIYANNWYYKSCP